MNNINSVNRMTLPARLSCPRFTRVGVWPAACALALLGAAPLAWGEDRISTDRPDFVESSLVVGKGRFQIETGFSFERNRDGDIRTRVSTMPTLLRYGVSNEWELRLETDGLTRLREDGGGAAQRQSGQSDLDLGAKWHMQDGYEATARPSVAWLLHATAPSGTGGLKGQGVRPSVRMVAEWELPRDWGVGVMPGVTYDTREDGKRFVSAIAAITVAKSWTENFRTYWEIAGQQLTSERNGGNVVTYDMGAAYLIGNDMQLDISGAWRATKQAPAFSWGVGLSVRF